MVHDHAARWEIFGFGQIANGTNVFALDHVIGRFHVDGGFVVKAFEVPAGLGEKHQLDAFTRIAFGELEGAVGAFAGGLVIDDGALDDAARGAFTASDDREFTAIIFANESGDFGGADFDGTDEGGFGTHGAFLG